MARSGSCIFAIAASNDLVEDERGYREDQQARHY
jgi:hypothetical protein